MLFDLALLLDVKVAAMHSINLLYCLTATPWQTHYGHTINTMLIFKLDYSNVVAENLKVS